MRIVFSSCSLGTVPTKFFCFAIVIQTDIWGTSFVNNSAYRWGQRLRWCCRSISSNNEGSHQDLRHSLHTCHLTTNKDLTGTGFGEQNSLGGLDLGNTHCSNIFQGRTVKNAYNSLSCWQEEEDGQCAGSLQIRNPGKSYYGPFGVWTCHNKCKEVWRRVELRHFNAKPELLHPRASSYLQCRW